MIKTKKFIEGLLTLLNTVVSSFYELAPTETDYVYAVVNDINIFTTYEHEENASIYIDVYVNENSPPTSGSATEELEEACDSIRNLMKNAIIKNDDVVAHFGLENLSSVNESEQDLTHRRITVSAKIYYVGG